MSDKKPFIGGVADGQWDQVNPEVDYVRAVKLPPAQSHNYNKAIDQDERTQVDIYRRVQISLDDGHYVCKTEVMVETETTLDQAIRLLLRNYPQKNGR